MVTARKNNITGQASHRILPASASSVSYRSADSQCDHYLHRGEWYCLNCPNPGGCLHDNESESDTHSTKIAEHQIQQKVTVNADDY